MQRMKQIAHICDCKLRARRRRPPTTPGSESQGAAALAARNESSPAFDERDLTFTMDCWPAMGNRAYSYQVRTWFRSGLVALAFALGAWAYVQQSSEDVGAPPSSEVEAGEAAATLLADTLLNRDRDSSPEMAWRIMQANSTADVMIVDVEAERPNQALAIAEEIVAPLIDSYVEVVVYVRSQNLTDDASVRRVQWTPGAGYVETTYSDQ